MRRYRAGAPRASGELRRGGGDALYGEGMDARGDGVDCGADEEFGHCITCSDEGVPMCIVALDEERGLALCETEAGARSSVEILLVAPVLVGDSVLVHAGTALRKIEEVVK